MLIIGEKEVMLKVVIIGYGEMLANLIAGALDAKCKIVGVLRYETVKYNSLRNKIRDFVAPSVDYSYIKSYNINDIKVKSVNSEEFKKEILRLNPDVILVGTWSEKLKKEIINLPKIAFINTHPSLLPKYRGPNPYLEVIRNQELKTGITFHLMDENYDSGAILLQREVEVQKYDTSKELKERIIRKIREAVGELLLNLDDDFIIPLVQNEDKATYYPHIKSEDVMLDFDKSAEEISAHIRALHPWYRCFFEYKNQFFSPDAYKIRILTPENDKYKNLNPGTIVYKNSKTRELQILTGDRKIIQFVHVRLYGKLKRFFTRFYIKFFVQAENN